MGERKLLQKESLGALFDKLRASGQRILAPRQKDGNISFEEIASPGEFSSGSIQTTLSAKESVFPRYEELFRYRLGAKDVKLEDVQLDPLPTVLFGLRPCDARSFAVLGSVFMWDLTDRFFKERMERTTVVSISCTQADDFCFCTSVGGGPGDTQGSDILLTPLDDKRYLAEILTEKGQALAAAAPELFAPAAGDEDKEKTLAGVPARFDLEKLAAGLPGLFNQEQLWIEQSLRCLGCGACAFVCPTCVCFDIQDEARAQKGKRVRCWDSCGFSLFTLHTSGHNPRSRQSQRWRQRVMHKFSYFQDRLGTLGCVGCGRCSRSCPADMNLAEHLKTLAEAAK